MPLPNQNPGGTPYLFLAETVTSNVDYQYGSGVVPPDVKITLNGRMTAYANYKIKIFVSIANTNISFVQTMMAGNVVTELTGPSGNFNRDVFANFFDLDQLAPGVYDVSMNFELYGVNNSGDHMTDSAFAWFSFNVVGNANPINTDKAVYKLIYNRQTNQLSGDTVVNITGNNDNLPLRFFNNLAILKAVDPINNNSFVLEENTPLSGNSNLPLEGIYEISCSIFKKNVGSPDVNVKSFLIQLIVLNGDMVVFPADFSFSLMQSLNEVKSQAISIINPYNKVFTIEGPNWLDFSAAGGSGTVDIVASTLNSMMIPVGNYSSNVIVKYDNKEILVPVTLTVISYIYLTGFEQYNFCLDNKRINFIKKNAAARFVRSTVTAYFLNEDENSTIIVPITIPYFDERGSFDIGYKIHQYFLRLKKSVLSELTKPNFDNKFWFAPAEVTMVVEELDADYNVLNKDNVGLIKLYPGKKPKGFPMLTNSLFKQRFAGSKYIFSYIQGLVDTSKIAMGTPNVFEDGIVTRVKIEDDENKIIFPKKKIFQITDQLQLTYLTLNLNGPNIINIQFENQNLVPDSFSFCGHFKNNPAYTHIYDQNLLNSAREKFDVTKVISRTINTGFLAKACVPVIDEIIKSRLCFLEVNGEKYRGFCTSDKIVDEDSAAELIQFDLEFLLEDYGN